MFVGKTEQIGSLSTTIEVHIAWNRNIPHAFHLIGYSLQFTKMSVHYIRFNQKEKTYGREKHQISNSKTQISVPNLPNILAL